MDEVWGAAQEQLARWLAETWLLEQGSVVCVVHGFPGRGKTALAGRLARVALAGGWPVCVREAAEAGAAGLDELVEVIAQDLHEQGHSAASNALSSGSNAAIALAGALRERVLLVIDEAHRLLVDAGRPEGLAQKLL